MAAATALACLAFAAGAAHAAAEAVVPPELRGLWVDHADVERQKVAIWIDACDGVICGRIWWLKKPLRQGEPKRDRRNPDTAQRDRPLCGLTILSGFRRATPTSWNDGRIYNPGDGRTYASTMTLDDDGTLRVTGRFEILPIGRTAAWVRPPTPLPRCDPSLQAAGPAK